MDFKLTSRDSPATEVRFHGEVPLVAAGWCRSRRPLQAAHK